MALVRIYRDRGPIQPRELFVRISSSSLTYDLPIKAMEFYLSVITRRKLNRASLKRPSIKQEKIIPEVAITTLHPSEAFDYDYHTNSVYILEIQKIFAQFINGWCLGAVLISVLSFAQQIGLGFSPCHRADKRDKILHHLHGERLLSLPRPCDSHIDYVFNFSAIHLPTWQLLNLWGSQWLDVRW